MDKKLKKIIFKKLYEDLSHVEIIPHNDSVWFIDRDNRYWYLEYLKGGTLFFRHPFFNKFFQLFSFEMDEYKQIIVDWVEEVLNCKVVIPRLQHFQVIQEVEEILNCKVVTPLQPQLEKEFQVEEILNCKVVTPSYLTPYRCIRVEEVLNCKVVTPIIYDSNIKFEVEEVLNCKVVTPICVNHFGSTEVEEVLNYEKQI